MAQVSVIEKKQPISENIEKLGRSNRIDLLDGLRGAAMVFVVVYHLIYDLIYFVGVDISFFYSNWFDITHSVFLFILFIVSGICTSFSRNAVKRGAMLYLAGGLITIGSEIVAPNNVIVFGVITFFGMMMMISGIIRPVTDKIPWLVLLIICLVLFSMFRDFSSYDSMLHLFTKEVHITLPDDRYYLYPLGITHSSFRSEDYFPLIPNGFIFLAGVALSKPIIQRKLPEWFYNIKVPVLNIIGKHSLLIYIVHQPVFLLIIFLIKGF